MNDKLLIIPDIHIGRSQSIGKSGIGNTLNSRIVDQLNLLDWIFDQALARSIKQIIITGDVFEDPRPNYTLVFLLIDWLQKCTDHEINVHIVVGNHDILRSGQFTTSPLDLISATDLDNVYIYKKINTLHLDGVSITFVPFRDRRSFNTDNNSKALSMLKAQLPYQLASIDKFAKKILVGHLALEGSIPVGNELDELSNEIFCPLDMFKGYDYVWMGHVHKFQIMSESPHIGHIGSMDISDFGETDQKKYIAILNEDGTHEYLVLPTRKLMDINIQLPDTECNATEFISNYLSEVDGMKNSIVKITVKLPSNASYAIDRSSIEKQLTNSGVFLTSKITEERTFTSVKKQINQSMDSAVDEFSALKTYSSIIEEELREDFIKSASNIINEFKINGKI